MGRSYFAPSAPSQCECTSSTWLLKIYFFQSFSVSVSQFGAQQLCQRVAHRHWLTTNQPTATRLFFCQSRYTMSFPTANNQTAVCNCRQASYDYDFVIVQLQADCIGFIALFLSFPPLPRPPLHPTLPPNWARPVTGFKS